MPCFIAPTWKVAGTPSEPPNMSRYFWSAASHTFQESLGSLCRAPFDSPMALHAALRSPSNLYGVHLAEVLDCQLQKF